MDLINQARAVADGILSEALPRRWSHVQGVADRAATLTDLDDVAGPTLVAAAWLHDVGYGPAAAVSGFHPLDGARYLRRLKAFPGRVVDLVAHHSCAVLEAEERGLDADLRSEFEREESGTADALWYADMTTGPDGESLSFDERIAEIRIRYGAGHVVTRFINRAEGPLREAVDRTTARIAAQQGSGEPLSRRADSSR